MRHQIILPIMMVFLCHATASNAKNWTEIRFGVEAEVPPFESRNLKGELVGLDIELGNALCIQMDARCAWIDQPYAGNIASLKAGKFDVIMPMTPTDTRKEEIDFTEIMYQLSNRLVVRKGENISPSIASLKGKRVGVLRGTSREAFALKKWKSAGVHVESFGLNTELIKSLLAENLDATLQDSIEISNALLDTPAGRGFEFSGDAIKDPLLGNGIAMGVRKNDPELKEALNQALTSIRKNGVYQAIVDRYLSSKKEQPTFAKKSELQYLGNSNGKPFSQAVRVDNMLYLSGVLGDDADGKFPLGTAAQTAAIMNNIRSTLETNGSSLKNVVQCKVILADIKDFADMNAVYVRYFSPGRFPARTTFEASNLVANAKVEIECMAHVE